MAQVRANDPGLKRFIAANEILPGVPADHLYLDGRGHPTFGIGHLIFRIDHTKNKQQQELEQFIQLCNKSGAIFWFKNKAAKKASWHDVRAELWRLVGIGQQKMGNWEKKMLKEFVEAVEALNEFQKQGANKSSRASQRLNVEAAEYKIARKKFRKGYNNMGAAWWRQQTRLIVKSQEGIKGILESDIQTKVINELKRGPWSRGVGSLPYHIQILVYDILFNVGFDNWVRFNWCKQLRKAIDDSDWGRAETILQSNVGDRIGNAPHRANARVRLIKLHLMQRIDQLKSPHSKTAFA